MDLGATLMALLAGLFVKGVVMFLGARLLWQLHRTTRGASSAPRRPWLLVPEEDRPDVHILWVSLASFVLSELLCGVEAYILFASSAVISVLHTLLSSLGMGLFGWGLLAVLDRRMVRFASNGCQGNRICRGCTILEPAGCKLRSLFLYIATFIAFASLAPLFVSTERVNADVTRYVLPLPAVNAWYDSTVVPWIQSVMGERYQKNGAAYYLPESMLVLEYRVLPLIAFLASILAIALLRGRREAEGLRALAFAAGVLCFVLLELVVYAATRDVIFGSLGHEAAELWFLLVTVELLRRLYPGRGDTVPDSP